MITHDGGTFTPLPGQSAASVVVATGYTAATTAEARGNALIEAMFAGRSSLNGKNVTETPSVVMAPVDYYNLVQSTRGVNNDYTSNNGGVDSGQIRQVAGFSVAWSNHLDTTDQSAGTGINATNLKALMYTKDVAGVVKAMDIMSEANYDFMHLGHQLTSYYALGMGILNPTGLVIINAD